MKRGLPKRISLTVIILAIMAFAAGSSLPCWASELAVLRNGFSIRHERREIIGAITRLYVSADGSSYVDVPTLEIEHFEAAPAERPGASFDSPPFAKNAKDGAPSLKPDLNEVVSEASGRYRLDPDLVNSVIKAESGFNVRAVSRKGAQGLMQLMPGTASKLGVPNAFDPQANVEGGTRYLRELLERYNFDLIKALAAYNAGPRRVEQYGGLPPYYETHAYVARIVRDFNKKKAAEKGAAPAAQKRSTKCTRAQTSARKAQSATAAAQAKATSTLASQ